MLGLLSSYSVFAQFTMTPTSFITIKDGTILSIDCDITIQGNATSSAYFVDQTSIVQSVSITGNVAVQRYLTDNEWHNVASPVAVANTSLYGTTWLTFYYDETYIQNDWMFGWFDFAGALTPMRGYDVFLDAGPLSVTYTGTGSELNTGNYSFNVTNSTFVAEEPAARKGWNLAGNPYASPVDWQYAAGWNKTDINNAKYIWDGIQDNYTIWIGGGAPIGINGGTQFIPSNQGFWVQAIQNGAVSINNRCRIGVTAATPDFYKNDPVEYNLLDLVSTGNGYSDETMIRFIDGTTAGFDWNYDASKLFSFEEGVPQISTLAGKFDVLAINTLPELINELQVGLNFQSTKSGSYEIRLTTRTKLKDNIEVYLKDNFDKKVINLSQDSAYHFYHQPTNRKNRFTIYFNPSDDVINNITIDSYFTIFSFRNEITILKNTVKQLKGEVSIYNISGQQVFKDQLSNEIKSIIKLTVPTGYYVISIKTNESIMNKKIFITN